MLNHYQLKDKLEEFQKLREVYIQELEKKPIDPTVKEMMFKTIRLEMELLDHVVEKAILDQYNTEHWEE